MRMFQSNPHNLYEIMRGEWVIYCVLSYLSGDAYAFLHLHNQGSLSDRSDNSEATVYRCVTLAFFPTDLFCSFSYS